MNTENKYKHSCIGISINLTVEYLLSAMFYTGVGNMMVTMSPYTRNMQSSITESDKSASTSRMKQAVMILGNQESVVTSIFTLNSD